MPGNDSTWRNRRIADAAADPGFAALKAQIIARTGHHYYADKDDLLFDRLLKRFRALGLVDAEAYSAHLDGDGGSEEWAKLEAEITIGETFFFRYAEQFTALKTRILPELLAARASQRRLRIWSAGCSTGAEPYSLAILLHELIGAELPRWDLSILGSDISASALVAAETAIYGRWALRTTPPHERDSWFQPVPDADGRNQNMRYRLRPRYRDMVRFERSNLLAISESKPSPSAEPFDLILCRNVLIYFGAGTISSIVRGLGERLAPDGWLLFGHAEPNLGFDRWLDPVLLPGTVAYRQRAETRPVVLPAFAPPAARTPRQCEANGVEIDAKLSSLVPGAIRAPAIEPPDETPAEALARIRALADSGETGSAWRLLQEANECHSTDPALRYYEGLLALGLGREIEAEHALRRALFLDRNFVMAHYHLGMLSIGLGRWAQARRSLGNAMRLARALPSETPLREGDGATAGAVIDNAELTLAGIVDETA